jgi:serine protease Do
VVDVEVIREGSQLTLRISIELLEDLQDTVVAKADLLGLQVQDITEELAKNLKLEGSEGVLVSDVTAGNAASEAGIRRGDVISEMNRSTVKDMRDYQNLLASVEKGSSVLFLIKRGGSTIYIAVKVG